MDFFGIGPMEIILILILGLLVFGPGKLPQIGKDLGKTFRSFKKAATDISVQVSKELEEEKADISAQVSKELKELQEQKADISTQVSKAVKELQEQKVAQADSVSKPEAGDQVG